MHFRYALVSIFLAILCADVVAGQHALRRRQDEGDAAPSANPSDAPEDQPPPSSSITKAPQKTNGDSPKSTQSKDNGDITSSITTSHPASSTSNSTAEAAEKGEKLPIEPSITPAIAIAGVVMIITGVAYTLIGIKHEWLLVFMSTAYVASLGVTVLIIYVMTPPVSDAIQGAYFVAVFMTGIIFGGFSLIFKDVTGGFGCLIGGFCLSMWLLCLKPGGLITSTTGKAVMIGVISVVGWSLAFSQYTRSYGSIFCTSFAGAMITIIGIDCFSRAGLKEFWIYIWGLNDQEFPLHTNTYPVTRGMRAELACTIVICVLGVISQVKVWKMVKERKAKKEEERQLDESHRDKRDSRYGKAIEKRNTRSLAAWEAVYGNRDSKVLNTASETTASTENLKQSTSVREREVDAIELDEVDTGTRQIGNGGRSSVMSKLQGQEATRTAHGLDLDLESATGESSWWDEFRSPRGSPGHSKVNSVDNADSNEPQIPALPFSPLAQQDEATKFDSGSRLKALSPVPARRDDPLEEDHEDEDITRIEDDRASSAAATLDEDPDFDALSKRYSLAASVMTTGTTGTIPPLPGKTEHHGMPESPVETPMTEKDNEELLQPLSSKHGKDEETDKQDTTSKQPEQGPVLAELKDDNLPRSISRVAHVYRTNEWAKHVAEADQPEIVDEQHTDEPVVHVDVGRTEEEPRPVDTVALTPEQMQPQFFRTASNPYRRNSEKVQRRTSSGGTPVYSFQRQSSNPSLNQTKREVRPMSKTLAQQTLVESPTEGSFVTEPNLMDERHVRVETGPSTTNFNSLVRPSSALLASPSQQSNLQKFSAGPVVAADMNLEQRQEAALAQPQQTTRELRPSSSQRPSTSRVSSTANQNLIYDSHQPKRSSTTSKIKQNAMLTQWRQSLQQENYDIPELTAPQRARQSMIEQLRYRDYQELKQQNERKKRQSTIELAMRTSNLTDKHKEAMKKMQAQVNEVSKTS